MRQALIVAAALAAGFAAGCKSESTTTTSPPSGGSSTPPANTGSETVTTPPATMPAMSDAGRAKVDAATRSAGDLAGRAGAMISGAATRPSVPAEGSTDAAGGVQGEAQKHYDQAMQAVKDKKFDVAEEALKKLEGMKSSLSPEWQAKIDSARTMLNGAKGAGSIPGLGGK